MNNNKELKGMYNLFATVESMNEFKEYYMSFLEKPTPIEAFNWRDLAADILDDAGRDVLEVGSIVEAEVNSARTKSGNPELVYCGQVVEWDEANGTIKLEF